MKGFAYLTKQELQNLPASPGVYSFEGDEGLLYIGKASNLRSRVRSHFNSPSYRDDLFMHKANSIGFRETPTEIDALILESELIKEQSPKYNVSWRDDKQYFFVEISSNVLPVVKMTHQTKDNEKAEYIGPFIDGRSLKRVLRLLRGIFPYYTTSRHPKLPCPSCHLGLCPGPEPDKRKYRKDINSIKEILKGKRFSVLKKLQREMKKASQEQNFERAAELRDQISSLERTMTHSAIIRSSAIMPNSSSSQISSNLQELLNTENPIIRAECYDISNLHGKEATGSQVVFIDGRPAKHWYRKYKIRMGNEPNDTAMLYEMISRRMEHTEWPYPDLMVIDGGKGQLGAALKALQAFSKKKRTNLSIQVVSLAKQDNELFVPDRKDPILLNQQAAEIRNFFMHIRDEAHRFALRYHRSLMKRR